MTFYLQRNHPWMQKTTEQTFLIEAFTERSITLEFVNVSLLMPIIYTIHGLNVFMYQAELLKTVLLIDRLEKQTGTGFVTITNSTFLFMSITRGSDISLLDCYIFCLPEYMLFSLEDCNLSISRSTVHGCEISPMILATAKCKIEIIDVNLVNNQLIFLGDEAVYMNNTHLNNVTIDSYFSLHIVHSQLNSVEMMIGDNSNITMTDTTVKYQRNYNLQFLCTRYNVRINMTNCTLSNIAVLLKAESSYISIYNSRISNSKSLKETGIQHFIDISYYSHLTISDTIITHNKPARIKTFFRGRINSLLKMYRCLYAHNSLSTHFVADDNTHIIIQESQFINNNSTTGILDMKRNKCIFNSCLFEANNGQMVINGQSSNITFTNCVFLNTCKGPEYTVLMKSAYVQLNNYLEIDNCTFSGGQGYLVWVKDVAEVSIQNSNYLQGLNPDSNTVEIYGVNTLRLANSNFLASSSNMDRLLDIHASMNFYTLQSSFGNKICSVTTNETDFVQKGDDLGFVNLYDVTLLKETGFASSK